MNRGLILMGGIGLGAGLTYLFDPATGKRRRALLRDKLESTVGRFDHYLDAAARDVCHRTQGLAAKVRSRFGHDEIPGDLLVERVRSKMGHFVSHPHAIRVTARDGRIMLGGPILDRELNDLLTCVASVQGVTAVENHLEVHKQDSGLAGLHNGHGRSRNQAVALHGNWSPAARLLAGAVGCGLMVNCAARRTPLAVFLGMVGFGMFVRGLTNLEMRRLIGVGAGCRAVDVHKSITVAAPVEHVFQFWAKYNNFPRFMSHLRAVRDLGDARSYWQAAGPAGLPLSWNAVLVQLVPNQLLAWRSEPGSTIANEGIIRFLPQADGSTRVDVHLSYNPPGGALTHFAAKLFGADVKSAMDEDLLRFKSLIEQGKTRAPGKKAARAQTAGKSWERFHQAPELGTEGQGI